MEDALEETYEDDSKTASTHSNSASGGSRASSSRSSNPQCQGQAFLLLTVHSLFL